MRVGKFRNQRWSAGAGYAEDNSDSAVTIKHRKDEIAYADDSQAKHLLLQAALERLMDRMVRE